MDREVRGAVSKAGIDLREHTVEDRQVAALERIARALEQLREEMVAMRQMQVNKGHR